MIRKIALATQAGVFVLLAGIDAFAHRYVGVAILLTLAVLALGAAWVLRPPASVPMRSGAALAQDLVKQD